jgi:pimeloyl-ACP methyl ester carboxylesterase
MIKIIKWVFIFLLLSLILLGITLYKGDLPLNYLEEKYANAYSQFIEVKGLRTHYRVEGQGPYLLLLHGTASSLHTWDRWTELLKEHFTVVRLDLPAFGLTGPNLQRDYSLDYYNDFVAQFVNKLDMPSFSLAGNSLGGGIAWYYTLNHQDRVSQLILIDPSGVPKDKVPDIFALAQNPATAFILKYITVKSFIRKNLEQVYFQDDKITDALVERYWELGLRKGNRQAFIDRANIAFQYPIDKLAQIHTPTLILWGEQDSWIPVSDAKVFSQNIPNSQSIIYPNVGHVPMEEIPDKTAQDSLNFLRTNQ